MHAFTLAGSWHSEESAELVNTAGPDLFEPAGSVHTFVAPASNTETTDLWFVIHGANLNLDADGNVQSMVDAATVYRRYRTLCRDAGHPDPLVVVLA